MIFRRKRQPPSAGRPSAVLRGRDMASAHGQSASGPDNPLARRFAAGDEPDTVDLMESAGVGMPVAAEDPDTSGLAQAAPARRGLISRDPQTGKLHVSAAVDDCEVLLNGKPVLAPTELRPGDSIRIGDAELQFLP